MQRTVSRFVGIITRRHDYLYDSSRVLFESTAGLYLCRDVRRNACWGMNHDQLSNKVSHLGGYNSVLQRLFSAQPEIDDESAQESELRRRLGWVIKILAAVTITYVGFNAYPLMGDSLIWQSVALVRLDDPFMKRSGASRIAMIATNDRRRKNFVEAGGVIELVKMLESASDDKTRWEAVNALVALCECEVAVDALNATGAEGLLRSLAEGSSEAKVENHLQVLLTKLEQWRGGAK